MLIGLILYFLVAVAILAPVCLPGVRDRVRDGAARVGGRCGAACARWRTRRAEASARHGAAARRWAGSLRESTSRRLGTIALSLALVAGLPLAAVLLRQSYRADSFDPHASREIDQRVAQLLQGEELVPPPALPPDFFTTTEVEAWQPLARSASRRWDLLDETFRLRLLLVFKLVRERYGYEMVLIEGHRSPQRQAALQALGPGVTRAGAFESYHQFGLAADCAFLRDGRIVISEKDPWAMAGYERYGEIARSVGLVWGGDWKSLRDFGHVELRRPRTLLSSRDNRPA